MTLFLLDPSLDHPNGHHLDWDLAIAREAQSRGMRPVILAHRDHPAMDVAGIEIRPWFTFTTYDSAASDRLTARYDDFRLFNERLAMDLAALPVETFHAGDVVLAPTLTERHLLGYATWMKRFEPVRAPAFALHLMFPPGPEEVSALLYRLALREVDRPGPPIHIFATGRERAAEFSELLGRTVPVHPIPLTPGRAAARVSDARPSCLLFLGDAKPEKGIALLPAVAERLARRHRGWDFVVHVNEATAWREARVTLADMRDLARHHANLVLRTEWLDRAGYDALLETADALVCLHEPVGYGRKSSGILWEAVSAGLPFVVSQGTWLEREAAAWGAGFVTCAEHGAAGFCEAFARLAEQRSALAALATQAAQRFGAENGAERLIGQLLRLRGGALGVTAATTTTTTAPALAAAAPKVPPEGFAGHDVTGRILRVDELLNLGEADYRHLDLSVHDLVAQGLRWPHVKFRICSDRGRSYLEFRRMAGWPDMFVTWPGHERDRYGDVFKLPADSEPLPPCAPDDLALFGALGRCLRDIISALAERDPGASEEWRRWMSEAEAHERSIGERLRDLPVAAAP